VRYRYWRERAYMDPHDMITPDVVDTLIDAALRNQ